MQVSNSCPIQFWPMNTISFNEQKVLGNVYEAFIQSFANTDTVKIQMVGLNGVYKLIVEQGSGNVTLDFVRIANGVYQVEFTATSAVLDILQRIKFGIHLQSFANLNPSFDIGSLNSWQQVISTWSPIPGAAVGNLKTGGGSDALIASIAQLFTDGKINIQTTFKLTNTTGAGFSFPSFAGGGWFSIGTFPYNSGSWTITSIASVVVGAFSSSFLLMRMVTGLSPGMIINFTPTITRDDCNCFFGFADSTVAPSLLGEVPIFSGSPTSIQVPAGAGAIYFRANNFNTSLRSPVIDSITINSVVKVCALSAYAVSYDSANTVLNKKLIATTTIEGTFTYNLGYEAHINATKLGIEFSRLTNPHEISIELQEFYVTNDAGQLFKSDEICFAPAPVERTIFLEYSNKSNFAGVDFAASPIFGLRIPAKFFDYRFPDETESEELSNSIVDVLSSSTKTQRFLEVEPVPSYMHKKIQLVLQHNTVAIEGEYWKKEEAYALKDIDVKHPFKLATCWLTNRNNEFVTNVYGEQTTIPSARIFDGTFDSTFE